MGNEDSQREREREIKKLMKLKRDGDTDIRHNQEIGVGRWGDRDKTIKIDRERDRD